MNEKTYQKVKQEYEVDLKRLMDIEAQLLAQIRELFMLLNERIPLAQQLKSKGEVLTRAARELGKDEVFKLRILANLPTPEEVVHDFMARYAERFRQQSKGAKLDYDSLVSNRIRPRVMPGIPITSTGVPVEVTAPRKLRYAGENGTPHKTGRGAGLTSYNRDQGLK